MSGRARPGRGLSGVGLIGLNARLSDRDRAVLRSVATHRFLTTNHIERLHFTEHATPLSASRTARRVIRRLAITGLLVALPRRVGGIASGSHSSVWRLSATAHRLLAYAAGDSAQVPAARLREPSVRFVDHAVAIADAHLALIEAARSGAFGLSGAEIEPRCWRSYLGAYGARETLKPDLAVATVSADGEFEDRWFVEVDLGTEHPPTVLRKCRQYEAYRRTGQEQQQHGVFPLVAWVTRDQQRADKLTAALAASRELDRSLFRMVAVDEFAALVAGAGSTS